MTNITRVVLAADSTQIRRGTQALGDMQRTGVRTQSTVAALGRGFSLLRTVLPIASVAGLALAGRRVVTVFADFESAMARVAAVSRATEFELQRMTATARELGSTTEFTGAQAASGLEFLARAGFTARDAIDAIPAVLDLATGATMDLGRAADITSNIMSAFGIKARDSAAVADVLAAASSRANTDVQQLGDAMRFVGPVASALGISINDAAAAVGTLSDAGIQGSAAGTGLRRVLSSLANPTSAALAAFRSLKLEVTDLNPQTNSLVEIVDRLSNAGLDAAQALTIFGDRGGPAILALVENNTKLQELTGGLSDIEGEAARMADTIRDTLTGDLQGLQSAMQGVAISIGDEMNPGLRSITQAATGVARSLATNFSGMIQSVRDTFSPLQEVADDIGSMWRPILERVNADFDWFFQTTGAMIGVETSGWKDTFRNVFGFVAASVLELPANFADFVRLTTVEFLNLANKAMAVGRAIAGALDPRVWFSSDRRAALAEELAADIAAINEVRLQTVSGILAAREARLAEATQSAAAAAAMLAEEEAKQGALEATAEAERAFAEERQRLRDAAKNVSVMDFIDPNDPGLDEAQAFFNSTRTEIEQIEAQIARVQELSRKGFFLVSGIDDQEILARLNEQLEAVRNRSESVGDSIKESIAVTAGGAIEEMFARGEISGSQFAEAILKDMARIMTQALIMKPLMDSLFSFFNIEGASGGASAPAPAVPGFATGGSMMIGGKPGPDANLVAMNLTRGEKVTVTTPAQTAAMERGSGGQIVNVIDQRGADQPPVRIESGMRDGIEELSIFIDRRVDQRIAQGGLDKPLQSTGMVRRRPGVR